MDEELIKELKEAASNLSYYNAAEGSSWSKEVEGRAKASARWNEIRKTCRDAGVNIKEVLGSGYLVDY